MQTKNKIPAFTLSEMVVVLILTSIVVGLAFSVLSLVQKHMLSIQNNFIQNTELNKLEQSLWIDFNRYSNITFNALEKEIIFSNELDSKSYRFYESYIVKGLDTFQVGIQDKRFFFDGERVETGTIDALKLATSKTFRSQFLFVFKQNDATPFIN